MTHIDPPTPHPFLDEAPHQSSSTVIPSTSFLVPLMLFQHFLLLLCSSAEDLSPHKHIPSSLSHSVFLIYPPPCYTLFSSSSLPLLFQDLLLHFTALGQLKQKHGCHTATYISLPHTEKDTCISNDRNVIL